MHSSLLLVLMSALGTTAVRSFGGGNAGSVCLGQTVHLFSELEGEIGAEITTRVLGFQSVDEVVNSMITVNVSVFVGFATLVVYQLAVQRVSDTVSMVCMTLNFFEIFF